MNTLYPSLTVVAGLVPSSIAEPLRQGWEIGVESLNRLFLFLDGYQSHEAFALGLLVCYFFNYLVHRLGTLSRNMQVNEEKMVSEFSFPTVCC